MHRRGSRTNKSIAIWLKTISTQAKPVESFNKQRFLMFIALAIAAVAVIFFFLLLFLFALSLNSH